MALGYHFPPLHQSEPLPSQGQPYRTSEPEVATKYGPINFSNLPPIGISSLNPKRIGFHEYEGYFVQLSPMADATPSCNLSPCLLHWRKDLPFVLHCVFFVGQKTVIETSWIYNTSHASNYNKMHHGKIMIPLPQSTPLASDSFPRLP
jgi:hypothetical protein